MSATAMTFDFTAAQQTVKSKGARVGQQLAAGATAADAVGLAAREGLFASDDDVLALAAAVESIAFESAAAGMAIALHAVVAGTLRRAATADSGPAKPDPESGRGPNSWIGALALSSEDVPEYDGGRLNGRAAWIAPMSRDGKAIVGARTGDELSAFAVALDAPGVTGEPIDPAGLRGLPCAHLTFANVPATAVGPTVPVMARVRVLLAAVGLGIGRRALAEALSAARAAGGGAAEEQTVQGLLADAATELDAAMLLTWSAALRDGAQSLSGTSMAKLAATTAAQRAVERATQVVGVESFRHGHIIEVLAQDVRALELFAGRTEALRAAVAAETLPIQNA